MRNSDTSLRIELDRMDSGSCALTIDLARMNSELRIEHRWDAAALARAAACLQQQQHLQPCCPLVPHRLT
jgi:hypothetical protein